ncbi:hypothetical protein GCM10007049_31190 [Echinicola pacifica]|uniref:Copper chaperone CopZ n=1 Tax=Echinicola pacifica TaxID=346377 RepID=A0A918UUT4_9BACT|nr:hypothetical protein [Echinicola pacifica]GGZ35527.1 hypothetical protein GCM10007049_31190 [Echinicola pacifica]
MKKFKTNLKCGACINAVKPELEKLDIDSWEVDLKDPERVLSLQGAATAEEVKGALAKAGYTAEAI